MVEQLSVKEDSTSPKNQSSGNPAISLSSVGVSSGIGAGNDSNTTDPIAAKKFLKNLVFVYLVFSFVTLLIVLSSAYFVLGVEDPGKNWIYESSSADILLNLSIGVHVPNPNPKITDVSVWNSFFPQKTNNMDIVDFETYPDATITNGEIVYNFKRLDFSEKILGYVSNLKSRSSIIPVSNKISYPLESVPAEYWKYLAPAENIDSDNQDIKDLARNLSYGKDDLYEIAFDYANWVKTNIRYSLDSATEDVAEKASWTLENRRGVCDELTSLYIALLRSSGIPARYVSGIAYTNSELFSRRWGFHGWAQVYFPGKGWIDFDPTYGQFGFVDLSHIPLMYSVDSGQFSLRRSSVLSTEPMQFSIDVTDVLTGKAFDSNVDVLVSLNSDEYAFDSYGIVTATVSNNNDYYIPYTLLIGHTRGIDVLSKQENTFLLAPEEERTLYWVFYINSTESDADTTKEYIFPIIVYTPRNLTFTKKFNVGNDYRGFNKESILAIAKMIDLKENRLPVTSGNLFVKRFYDSVDFSCVPEKAHYYSYENMTIDCLVQNKAGFDFGNSVLCIETIDKSGNPFNDANHCRNVSLSPGNRANVSIVISDLAEISSGFMKANIYSNEQGNSDMSLIPIRSSIVKADISPELSIEIFNLDYPERVVYGQGFEVSFLAVSNSKDDVLSRVFLEGETFNDSWELNVTGSRPFTIQMNSLAFVREVSKVKLKIEYLDRNGKKYEVSRDLFITLDNLTVLEHIELFFNRIGNKLSGILGRN